MLSSALPCTGGGAGDAVRRGRSGPRWKTFAQKAANSRAFGMRPREFTKQQRPRNAQEPAARRLEYLALGYPPRFPRSRGTANHGCAQCMTLSPFLTRWVIPNWANDRAAECRSAIDAPPFSASSEFAPPPVSSTPLFSSICESVRTNMPSRQILVL